MMGFLCDPVIVMSFVVRPVQADDLEELENLVAQAGVGITSLAIDTQTLRNKIQVTLASFEASVRELGDQQYLFVLEDLDSESVVGMSAVRAAVGLREPFYSYRIGTIVHASKALDVHSKFPALYLSNDYTGSTELTSLYLYPSVRGGRLGTLISKARLLFIAEFPDRFAEKVIAEIRGVSTDDGHSPFWDGLGKHFFSMDFPTADYLVGTGNKSFIAELMPKHPIYALFLPTDAQEVIGQAHQKSKAALRILEEEGFHYEGYVDIFDAGPTVECRRDQILTVRSSLRRQAHITPNADRGQKALISNTRVSDFRCCVANAALDGTTVGIASDTARALRIAEGEPVRVRTL